MIYYDCYTPLHQNATVPHNTDTTSHHPILQIYHTLYKPHQTKPNQTKPKPNHHITLELVHCIVSEFLSRGQSRLIKRMKSLRVIRYRRSHQYFFSVNKFMWKLSDAKTAKRSISNTCNFMLKSNDLLLE